MNSQRSIKTYGIIIMILVLAILIRTGQLSDEIGGYHGWNEAFYLIKALKIIDNPLSVPEVVGSYRFTSPPPLYDYMLAVTIYILPNPVMGGRILSVLFSIIYIWLVYSYTKDAYGRDYVGQKIQVLRQDTAHVLVGGNIQTDMPTATALVAMAFAYLRWEKSDEDRYLI